MRMRRTGFLRVLAIIGPGLIAANAGNDAPGIATYSSAGAQYGYSLLWAMLLIAFGVAIVQEMAARMGAVTGKGLTDLIRENFGVRWTLIAVIAFLIAASSTIVANFAGIGAALAFFGIPIYLSVPVIAALIWYLVVRGSYTAVERAFLAMSLVFLGYIASAFLARPDWSAVASGLRPRLQTDSGYILLLVALIGTTISPHMQLFVQSAVAEKGIRMRDYPLERLDVYLGSFFACTIATFIIITTGATLHRQGITIESAADAAMALRPLAGPYATALFSIGLFGASMLATGVLPLATAYAVSEAFGFERGVSRSFEEAPFFTGLFTVLLVIGALVALIPGINPIDLMIYSQVIQGILLPVTLLFIMRLVNDRDLMGDYVNSRLFNFAAWSVTVVVSILSVVLIVVTLQQAAGVIA
ncbi:MAG: Nramp family divalent metal transporter [Armatimonadetes bacterium]|nr:Nramp family divalent metal transporter [Armatimonadota bacterium]